MAFDRKNQSKTRNVIITVVAVILALSMTVPSIGVILSRSSGAGDQTSTTDVSSSSSTSGTAGSPTTILDVSQGYADTFADLKSAQASSDDPTSYLDTFKDNYEGWAAALYQFSSENDISSFSEIDSAYVLLTNSIEETAATTDDPGAWDYYLAYDYFCHAYSLLACQRVSGTDLSSQLGTIYDEGIAYHLSSLERSHDKETAGNLATMYYWKGDISDAIATAEDALARYPDYAVVWYNLGNYYSADGDTDKALDAYQQALDLDADGEYGVADLARTQIESLGGSDSPTSSAS